VAAGKQEVERSETVDITNVSNLTIPPKLPIVIDVAAVEDILGVSIYLFNIKIQYNAIKKLYHAQ